MITVGYGDIHPRNIYEKIFAIGVNFLSCGVFAYCLNRIGNAVKDFSKEDDTNEKNMVQLTNFM